MLISEGENGVDPTTSSSKRSKLSTFAHREVYSVCGRVWQSSIAGCGVYFPNVSLASQSALERLRIASL